MEGGDNLKYHYTEKQYKELLSHMIILVDTREKSNKAIIDWFNKNDILFEFKSLKTGDYSFKISPCPELGFYRETFFTDELCIERKNSVSELAGNLVEKDVRFLRETHRMSQIKNVYMLIENDNLSDIIEGNYESKYNSDSYLRTLLTLQKRSDIYLYFVESRYMAKFIYEICKNLLDSTILK